MGLLEFSLSTYPFSDAWREPRSNRAISEIRTPKTFSTQNLQIRKFCSTFAPIITNPYPLRRHGGYKKSNRPRSLTVSKASVLTMKWSNSEAQQAV